MYKEPRLYVYEQVVILVRYMYILILLFLIQARQSLCAYTFVKTIARVVL